MVIELPNSFIFPALRDKGVYSWHFCCIPSQNFMWPCWNVAPLYGVDVPSYPGTPSGAPKVSSMCWKPVCARIPSLSSCSSFPFPSHDRNVPSCASLSSTVGSGWASQDLMLFWHPKPCSRFMELPLLLKAVNAGGCSSQGIIKETWGQLIWSLPVPQTPGKI